jgi:hypothetical protein
MDDAKFTWGGLGERWWSDAGEQLRASPELVKFACARHQGASAAASARLAGITGTAVSIRQAGYRMLRTTTVSNLLALAAAEDNGIPGGITAREIDAKLAKMIRNPDSMISLRAIEAHGKRQMQAELRREGQVEDEPTAEEDVHGIFCSCHTVEATLLCYAELHLVGNPGRFNKIGIGYGCHSPFMAEMMPHLVRRFPEQWQRYRAELVGPARQMEPFIAKLESGPLVPFEEIAEKVRVDAEERRRWRHGGPKGDTPEPDPRAPDNGSGAAEQRELVDAAV